MNRGGPLDRLSGFGRGLVTGVAACALIGLAVWAVHGGQGGQGSQGSQDSQDSAGGAARQPDAVLTPAPSGSPVPAGTVQPTSSPTEEPPVSQPTSPPPGASGPAGPLPEGKPVRCPAPTVEVATADQLVAALAGARAGTSIQLADGTYQGRFVAAAAGTADAPIWLCGEPGAVLDGGGTEKGYVLHLLGASFWRVVGMTVTNGQKGVVADATRNSVIQSMTVHDIGDEAIHLRAASSGNLVIGNTVHTTGLRRAKFGEGIYVGSARSNWGTYSAGGPDRSDHNLVQGNTISDTTGESVDVKEGTTGGAVVGNTFDGTGMTGADSWVDVKGNDWRIEGNTGRNSPKDGYQTHQILDGWGTGNVFRRNTVDGDVPGLGIALTPVLGNVVTCDNRSTAGSPVSTNATCPG